MLPDALVTGSVLLYQLWDLGDEVDLPAADRLFTDSAPARLADDIYLGRVYTDAMRLFRADVWRADIARKLETLRAAYNMLHAETQTTRSAPPGDRDRPPLRPRYRPRAASELTRSAPVDSPATIATANARSPAAAAFPGAAALRSPRDPQAENEGQLEIVLDGEKRS
jgi:hypothetical protein